MANSHRDLNRRMEAERRRQHATSRRWDSASRRSDVEWRCDDELRLIRLARGIAHAALMTLGCVLGVVVGIAGVMALTAAALGAIVLFVWAGAWATELLSHIVQWLPWPT